VRVQRPRATRYSFIASVILTDLETGHQTQKITGDLSLFGCRVVPENSTPFASRVRIQIIHNRETFDAQGRVTSVQPLKGVGIMFTKIEERYQLVLDKWIAELRKSESHACKEDYQSSGQ
jgi:hypothetical protein